MKDIKITARRQKIELVSIAVCVCLAILTNVHAILKYNGQWSELYTSIGFTLVFAAVLYGVWTILRLLLWMLLSLGRKKQK
ncbi:MAG: hypothetical protein IJV45_05305 [Prevotella sp.]|nr:hypothetical protein [Prevotella sp.]